MSWSFRCKLTIYIKYTLCILWLKFHANCRSQGTAGIDLRLPACVYEWSQGEKIWRPPKCGRLLAGTCSAVRQKPHKLGQSGGLPVVKWRLIDGFFQGLESLVRFPCLLWWYWSFCWLCCFLAYTVGARAFQAGVNHSSHQSCVSALQLF